MQEEEFVSTVQRRANIEADDDAYAATTATLRTLGERITRGEAEDIASQLPATLEDALTDPNDERPEAEEFPVDEFVERVEERERDRVEEATIDGGLHAQAVTTTLGEAVSGSELDDAREQLPEEFEELFEPVDMSEEQF